jgi:23S rRNA pseudouridine2605 synthase
MKAKNKEIQKAGMRLNRFLAACGLGSRRSAEKLIAEGRVFINGRKASSPGLRVGADDLVEVDGVSAKPKESLHVLLNKPRGVVCSVKDPHNETVLELLPPEYARLGVFPVGRLDKMSEGLIILSNDGEMAFQLTHPSFGTEKSYDVLMKDPVKTCQLSALKNGTCIEGKLVRPSSVVLLPREPKDCWVRFVLREGIKREIRRISKEAGLDVQRLIRVGIGKMRLEKLKPGEWRSVTKKQLLRMINQGGFV